MEDEKDAQPKNENGPIEMPKGLSNGAKIFLAVILGLMFVYFLITGPKGPESYKSYSSAMRDSEDTKGKDNYASEWRTLCGNVYPGVKVYYGIDKSYWGTVLSSKGDYVQVRMSDGSVELKDRQVVICGGGRMEHIQLFVRSDDPALR